MSENNIVAEEFETTRLIEIEPDTREMTIRMGVSSIIGTRDNQQDTSFGQVDGNQAVAIVCDGMGGLNGGEKASQTAVEIFIEDYYKKMPNSDISAFFREEAYIMNSAVRELEDENGEPLKGGTTVVAVIIIDDKLYWLNVGDSKIFLIRDKEILTFGQEHNLRMRLDEQLRTGEITPEEYREEEKDAEALISFLGIEELTLIETNDVPYQLKENDIILLCSDGLYKTLTEDEIYQLVFYEEPDMKRAARRLTDIVEKKKKRSQDNTSIVVMQYGRG